MTIQVVNKTDTFAAWREKTNTINVDAGDINAITSPLVPRNNVITTNVVVGSPRNPNRMDISRGNVWQGRSAVVNVSIRADGLRYILTWVDGGTDYRNGDLIIIPGDKLDGIFGNSTEANMALGNDIAFTLRNADVDSNGAIINNRTLTTPRGIPVRSLKNIITRIRDDIGYVDLSTDLITEINPREATITPLVPVSEALVDRKDAIRSSITSFNTLIGTGIIDAVLGNELNESTNELYDLITAMSNDQFGGSMATDYIGSDTTVIAALNTLADTDAVTTVLATSFLERDGSNALTGTLNVVEFGITSNDNTFVMQTGASDTNRLEISSAGNVGINKSPTTHQVDIDGNLNATQLLYAGVDIETKYLPISGSLTQSMILSGNSEVQGATTLPTTISFGSEYGSFTYPNDIYTITQAMVTDNIEASGFTGTYQTSDNTIDFDYSADITSPFFDIGGTMFDGGVNSGGITPSYNARTQKIDFAIDIVRDLANLSMVVPSISFHDGSVDIQKFDIEGDWTVNKALRIVGSNPTWTTLTDATTSIRGVIEIATQTESAAGTATDLVVTPRLIKSKISADIVNASTASRGVIELPTQTESDSGTTTNLAMTPTLVARQIGRLVPNATNQTAGLIEIASSSESNAATSTDKVMTPTLVRNRISVATPNATTSTRGLIEIATDSEAEDGVDTTRVVTPRTAKTRIDTITPQTASPTQKGRVQFASTADLADRDNADVVSVSDAYDVIRGHQRVVDTDWLYNAPTGLEMTDLSSGTAIDCGQDITLYNYLEITYFKLFRIIADPDDLERRDNQAGEQTVRIRVDNLPVGKPFQRGPGAVTIEEDNHQAGTRHSDVMFYMWIDPNDNSRLFFEFVDSPGGRLWIYNIFGMKNAGATSNIVFTLSVAISRSVEARSTVPVGQSVSLGTVVSGTARGEVTYQWQTAAGDEDFTNVPSATGSGFQITETTPGTIRQIRCNIVRGGLPATSNVVTIRWT